MSFAKRLLSSVGIGAATVDTRLEKTEFTPGEEVRGVVEIKGGSTAQEIEGINVFVQTLYKRESGDHTVTDTGTIGQVQVSGRTTAEEGTHQEIPFDFRLPYDTPLTVGRTRVWIGTSLDVRSAFDPSDEDTITVRPGPAAAAVLAALERLGFRLREAENEELSYHLRRNLPFGQEFEFVATGGEFWGKLDELEAVMFPDDLGVDVALQVDRRARGLGSLLSEAAGMDESRAAVKIANDDAIKGPAHVAEKLGAVIRRYA